jgi:hypothetical protein
MSETPVTVLGMKPPPEGYGPEVIYGLPPSDKHLRYNFVEKNWVENELRRDLPLFYTLKAPPWYPSDWLDENGKPLPDVFEHDGHWPKHCETSDLVLAMHTEHRNKQQEVRLAVRAGAFDWAVRAGALDWGNIVAYRVIKRAAS